MSLSLWYHIHPYTYIHTDLYIGSWFDVRGNCLYVLPDPVSCPLPPHGQEGLVPAHFILTSSCKVAHVVVAVPEEDKDTSSRVPTLAGG